MVGCWLQVILLLGLVAPVTHGDLPFAPSEPLETEFLLSRESSDDLQATSVFGDRTVFFREGLVIPLDSGGSWDGLQVSNPSVLIEGGVYRMWYHGCSPSYVCRIGYATSADGSSWTKLGYVLSPDLAPEGNQVQYPSVLKVGQEYRMWYNGWDGSTFTILAANSTDGISWTKHGVVMGPGPSHAYDAFASLIPRVLHEDGTFRMYYTGFAVPTPSAGRILLATSVDGFSWLRVGLVIDIGPPGSPDSYGVEGSGVTKVGSAYEMVYRAQTSHPDTSLMYAVSNDGIEWQKLGVALMPLAPDENLIGWPFVLPLANDSADVYYAARAGSSDLQIYLAWQTQDTEPPWTRSTAQGTFGDNGWYITPTTVTLQSMDNLTGIASIEYRLNLQSWLHYDEPFVVGAGANVVQFRASDIVGNWEVTNTLSIPVDTDQPRVLLPAAHLRVTRSDVTIGWSASDSTSGVDHLEVSVDGGALVNTGSGNSTVLRLTDGNHALVVVVFDRAGHNATASTTVHVDTNPFSPSGPYLGIPTYALIALASVVVASVVYRFVKGNRNSKRPQ